MSELLIELFYEEIPALMQKNVEKCYQEIFGKYLQKNHIKFEQLEVFISPRRITIHVDGMDNTTSTRNIEFKGPAVNGGQEAISWFCKIHNITKNNLLKKTIKNQNFYIYNQTIEGQKVENLLFELIPNAIKEYIWPKSMYWGEYNLQSVRPLKNILCLFDGKIIPFKYGHLIANNTTYGHRFMGAADDFKPINFNDYCKLLKENYVILDRKKRIEIIKSQMDRIAFEINLNIMQDDMLLDEVAGLVEYPVAMIGRIDEKFLKLPKEVLISSIRTHQKYFNLLDKTGNLAPYFLFVSNIKSKQPEIIINGNQKVLAARLSDALYFYNQDCKKPLESLNPALKLMIFHSKLGNMEEKIYRIAKICHYLDPENIELQLAARICKSDLVTQMVNEFPELQAVMGYYYSLNEGLSEEVALAIRDHYKPLGPNSIAPIGNSALLALSDKIDSLVGLMLGGEISTGSKDPYALRRLTLGIIRIILENHLHVNLKELINFSSILYKDLNSPDVRHQILTFISERVKNYFKDEFDNNLLQAVIDLDIQSNLIITKLTLNTLQDFLQTQIGQECLAAYKRINNIISDTSVTGELKQELFVTKYEKNLETALVRSKDKLDLALSDNNFMQAIEALRLIIKATNDFFDNIRIKDQNSALTNNRLLLIQNIKNLFHQIAKFNLL